MHQSTKIVRWKNATNGQRWITTPTLITSWIENEFVPPTGSSEAYDNVAPNSRHVLCRVEPPSMELIGVAVTHSRRAADEWSEVSSWDRGAILREMAHILRQNEAELCELEALDTGLPLSQVEVNHIPFAISTLEYYASLIQVGLPGKVVDTPHAGGHAESFAYTRREPLGVCLGIGAWNYPLMGMMWKVAPALACGNSMIFKPSECTPMSAMHVASLFSKTLPPSLLQVMPGDGNVAQTLLQHELIDKVSVTGSVETGKLVAQQAARSLIRATLELGGKSPLLVFNDADMESSIRVAADGNFVNNGQVCSNCTRVYVQNECLDEFVELLLSHLKEKTVVGDNMNRATTMGPMMKHVRNPAQHFERVKGFVERAKVDPQVDLLMGGKSYETRTGAYHVEPTVFLSRSNDAEIVRNEIFGPVMTILPFDKEEEAVQRANDSDFGLAAGVMTTDLARAHRVARKLNAGTVWINQWNLSPLEVPFGPYRKSGYGKELGVEALEEYSQTKSVYVEMGDVTDSLC